MKDHQELRDQIPALALGILEPDQTGSLQQHLAGCPTCQREFDAMLDIVGHLGYGAPDAQPPAGMRERIIRKVQPENHAGGLPKIGFWRRLTGWKPAFSFISLGLIVVLLVSNLLMWNQMRPATGEDFSTIRLFGTGAMHQASGLIVISPDGQYGTLVVSDLAPLPADQQYQLWLVRGDQRATGAVFTVAESGYGTIKVYSHDPLVSYDTFGITIEPFGGSPGPTGEKVLGSK
jgi:anti-sigma-K factor RskA